jgi:exodeoxyribonuclease V alpha subunit
VTTLTTLLVCPRGKAYSPRGHFRPTEGRAMSTAAKTSRPPRTAWARRAAAAVNRTETEHVGTAYKIRWYDDESRVVIAELRTGLAVKGQCAPGELQADVSYRFLGRWEDHHRHGLQFVFQTFVPETPASRAGVEKWLRDNARHVGEITAGRLWMKYGPEAVDVLRLDPARVASDGLLPLEHALAAAADLQRVADLQRTKIDLFGLFDRRGFPRTLIEACIRMWGARAADMVRKNPWLLLTRELPGCGFKRVDRLYLDLGGNRSRLKRQMLAAWHALREDTVGHTWVKRGAVVQAVRGAVPEGCARPDDAIALGLRARRLATYTDATGRAWTSEYQKAKNERIIAECVRRLNRFDHCLWPKPTDLADAKLSAHQLTTLASFLHSPLGILTGTPGTGKSYTAAAVLRAVVRRFGRDTVCVCAPTGKAAVRITAALQNYGLDLQATTIHRLLGITRNGHDGRGWDFEYGEHKPLPFQFVVVDEWSMADTDIAAALLSACDLSAHVLLVGDPYQLPPVGHGAPLRDLIAAGVPCGELTEIQRQGKEPNLIVRACAAIKNGRRFETCDRWEPQAGRNLKLIEARTADDAIASLQSVLSAFRASGKFDPVWDVQVLMPINERSQVSRVRLNGILQGLLNPGGAQTEEERRHAHPTFRVNDKIICLRNTFLSHVVPNPDQRSDWAETYELARDAHGQALEPVFLANGDVGRVLAVSPTVVVAKFSNPDRVVRVPMGKPKRGEEGSGEETGAARTAGDLAGSGSDFALAYAITGHKSQGSEWGCVIVMIDDQGGFVASREWVYTVISRATRLAILIGKRATIDRQCKRVTLAQRKTFLKELLTEKST